MFVFLLLLPTRELSDTPFCIPQGSCFGFLLVTFPSSGCPHVNLSLGKKLLTNDVHHNTNFSSPSSQGRLGWFPPHLYFPKFHRPLQVSGPKQPEYRFSGELLMGTTIITMFTSVLELLCIPCWPFSYLHALLFRIAHTLLHLEHDSHSEGCFCNCVEWSSLPQLLLFHLAAGGEGLGPVSQSKSFWNMRLSYRFSWFCCFWT